MCSTSRWRTPPTTRCADRSGSWTPTPSSQFREALGGLASKQYLLIDLSAVPFMDSAGLGALIGGIRRAREAGGDVAVACSRPTLTRLLHTTGFDRIVSVTETVDDAAAALADARPAT